MEDDYELVSKRLVTQLKEENAKLKSQISSIPGPSKSLQGDSSLVQEILDALHDESQKERELILENLAEIKDLNKSTLDNLLTKTEQLDERLEGMVDTIEGLVQHLATMVESLSGLKDGFNVNDLHDKISEIGKNQMSYTPMEMPKFDNVEIISKLNEISIFMENLRILLSYIKPSNVTLDKSSRDAFLR